MVHDLAVVGATVAGLTAARRLACEGFDVVVLDPNSEGVSAAIGHGVAACAHSSTVAAMSATYGPEAAQEHVRRNLVGLEEIQLVLAAGSVAHTTLPLHDHSLGVALDRELAPMLELLTSAGADVRLLTGQERRRAGAGLISSAVVVDPWAYAEALLAQARDVGVEVHHDVTVTHLLRRDGMSVVAHRDNRVWARQLGLTKALAVIDTLGVSPWGRLVAMGPTQYVPRLRFRVDDVPDVVTLTAGSPVWLVRPDADEVVAYGPKCSGAGLDAATAALERWVTSRGGRDIRSGSLAIDPSDHGRPIVGASAIPGGFYARGNGRGELMNGTASGCYLASLLLGYDPSAQEVALPWHSRIRAQTRALGGRLMKR